MKKLIAAALTAALLLSPSALAGVKTKGEVKLRSEPRRSAGVLGSAKKGRKMEYLNESYVDNRGVRWYKVEYKGQTGWVSSKYAVLTDGDEPNDVNADALKNVEDEDEEIMEEAAEETEEETEDEDDGAPVEINAEDDLSTYLMGNLASVAGTMGLKGPKSTADYENEYGNKSLALRGSDKILEIEVTVAGYAVCGAEVGMSTKDADKAFTSLGLEQAFDLGNALYYMGTIGAKKTEVLVMVTLKGGKITEILLTADV